MGHECVNLFPCFNNHTTVQSFHHDHKWLWSSCQQPAAWQRFVPLCSGNISQQLEVTRSWIHHYLDCTWWVRLKCHQLSVLRHTSAVQKQRRLGVAGLTAEQGQTRKWDESLMCTCCCWRSSAELLHTGVVRLSGFWPGRFRVNFLWLEQPGAICKLTWWTYLWAFERWYFNFTWGETIHTQV